MDVRQKLKAKAGFSLAEMLLAVLILLLVSGIVAAGVPAARNAYEKVIIGSNAQVLLSTAANALRDELGTAWDVTEDETTGGISYFSTNTGARSTIYTYEGVIKLREYADVDDLIVYDEIKNDDLPVNRAKARSLVTGKAATDELSVTYKTVAIDRDKNTVVFTEVKAGRLQNGTLSALIEIPSITIPVFSTRPIVTATDDDSLGD